MGKSDGALGRHSTRQSIVSLCFCSGLLLVCALLASWGSCGGVDASSIALIGRFQA